MKRAIQIMILLAAFASLAFAQATPRPMPQSLYTDSKAFGVGDVVTILLMEYSSGSNEASTNTGFENLLDASYIGSDKAAAIGGLGLKAGISNNSKNNGNTSRQGSLKGKLSARVVEILPNGQLKLEGQRKVVINGEEQTTVLSGVVRRGDILADNTVYSYLISDAAITYKGRGVVDQAQQPGILSRFLNWLF